MQEIRCVAPELKVQWGFIQQTERYWNDDLSFHVSFQVWSVPPCPSRFTDHMIFINKDVRLSNSGWFRGWRSAGITGLLCCCSDASLTHVDQYPLCHDLNINTHYWAKSSWWSLSHLFVHAADFKLMFHKWLFLMILSPYSVIFSDGGFIQYFLHQLKQTCRFHRDWIPKLL